MAITSPFPPRAAGHEVSRNRDAFEPSPMAVRCTRRFFIDFPPKRDKDKKIYNLTLDRGEEMTDQVHLSKRGRLISLDVFRGVTIAGMILVNNPGSWSSIYAPLRHAEWHGGTPTDLIFPFFLFIVGVAMTFSFAKRMERGSSKTILFGHVIKRSIIIFALGLLLAFFPKCIIPEFDLSKLRIPGVLQRIALCYFFASIIIMNCGVKGRAYWAVGLIILYWALMKLMPVPGYGAGDMSQDGNLVGYIDRNLIPGSLWLGNFDPEGLLSTIPAISTTLFGVLTGNLLRSPKSDQEKVILMFVFGNVGLVLGLIMDIWFPINKNLWSSSYVVFTAGFALHFLAMCYWVIEMKGYKKWAYPFLVYGTNAIFVYVASGIVGRLLYMIRVTSSDGNALALKTWIYQNLFASWAGDINGSLFFAISYVILWFLILVPMYQKRIFIKI